MKRFWMICRTPTHAGSKTEPKARYTDKAEAQRAAQDLANQNGAAFTLLEAVETIHPASDQQSLL